MSRLLGIAGALALGLAAFGLYGITAYTVTRRTREIGVRIALGASRGGVLRMILGDAIRLAVGGILAGLLPGFLLMYALSGMIFGIQPTDVRAIAVSTVLLMLAAVTASYVPARRALKVDPIVALRADDRGGAHAARLRLRATASESTIVPQAASAAACGHSRSRPMPFRKIPRTITRK